VKSERFGVLSGHKKRSNRSICDSPQRIIVRAEEYVRLRSILLQPGLQCRNTTSQGHGPLPRRCLAREFLARRSGLSDVTDRSHHWIRAISRQTILGLKCFGGTPRRMPFLGAETALLCVGGRRIGISPVFGPVGQNRRISRGRDSGAVLERFTGSGLQGRASPRRLSIGPTQGKPASRQADDYGRFFVETVPKSDAFGTGAPRKRLDLV
jgi:hypothetical protein